MRLGRRLLDRLAQMPYVSRFFKRNEPKVEAPFVAGAPMLPPAHTRPYQLALPPAPEEKELEAHLESQEEKKSRIIDPLTRFFSNYFGSTREAPHAKHTGPTEWSEKIKETDAEWDHIVGYSLGEPEAVFRHAEDAWNEVADQYSDSPLGPLYTRMNRRPVPKIQSEGFDETSPMTDVDDIAQKLRLFQVYAPASRSVQPDSVEEPQPKVDLDSIFDETFEQLGITADPTYTRPESNTSRLARKTQQEFRERQEELRQMLIKQKRDRGEEVSDDAYLPQRSSGLPKPSVRAQRRTLEDELRPLPPTTRKIAVPNGELSTEQMREGTIYETGFQEANYRRNLQDPDHVGDMRGVTYDEHGMPYIMQESSGPVPNVDLSGVPEEPQQETYVPPVSRYKRTKPQEDPRPSYRPKDTSGLPRPSSMKRATVADESRGPDAKDSNVYAHDSFEGKWIHEEHSQEQPVYAGVVEAEIVEDSGSYVSQPTGSTIDVEVVVKPRRFGDRIRDLGKRFTDIHKGYATRVEQISENLTSDERKEFWERFATMDDHNMYF